jgi:hypothetical protein
MVTTEIVFTDPQCGAVHVRSHRGGVGVKYFPKDEPDQPEMFLRRNPLTATAMQRVAQLLQEERIGG